MFNRGKDHSASIIYIVIQNFKLFTEGNNLLNFEKVMTSSKIVK